MADRSKSTVPDPVDAWTELQPFRETFLRHFTTEGDREALMHMGRMVFEMALESAPYWPKTDEPVLVEELRTAAADLRYLHTFLFYTIEETGRGSMKDTRREVWLLAKASEWTDQLGEIATEMEQALRE